MRGHGLTVLFCFLVLGFFALVAAEDYAWTSWHAYTLVHSIELALVLAVVILFNAVLAILQFIDWCHMHFHRMRNRKRR